MSAHACEELVGSSVKFHWSSPDLPAFCLHASMQFKSCSVYTRSFPLTRGFHCMQCKARVLLSAARITRQAAQAGALGCAAPHHGVDGQVRVDQRFVEPPATDTCTSVGHLHLDHALNIWLGLSNLMQHSAAAQRCPNCQTSTGWPASVAACKLLRPGCTYPITQSQPHTATVNG